MFRLEILTIQLFRYGEQKTVLMNIDQYDSICIKPFEDDEAFEWVSVTDDTMEPLYDIKTADGRFCETVEEAIEALTLLGWRFDRQEGERFYLTKENCKQ